MNWFLFIFGLTAILTHIGYRRMPHDTKWSEFGIWFPALVEISAAFILMFAGFN